MSGFSGMILPSPRGMPGELPRDNARTYLFPGCAQSDAERLTFVPIRGMPSNCSDAPGMRVCASATGDCISTLPAVSAAMQMKLYLLPCSPVKVALVSGV